MKSIMFYVNKGGVGKSTLSVLFAWYLRRQNQRVLFVDFDPQASATNILQDYKASPVEYAIRTIRPAIELFTPQSRIFSSGQSATAFDLLSGKDIRTPPTDYLPFVDAIDAIPPGTYDYIVVDSQVAYGTLVEASGLFCENILLPYKPGKSEFDALDRTFNFVTEFNALRVDMGMRALNHCGVAVTDFDNKSQQQTYLDMARTKYPRMLLEPELRHSNLIQATNNASVPPWLGLGNGQFYKNRDTILRLMEEIRERIL